MKTHTTEHGRTRASRQAGVRRRGAVVAMTAVVMLMMGMRLRHSWSRLMKGGNKVA